MGWKRRDAPISPTTTDSVRRSPADAHIVTDGAVLDELSRVFEAGGRSGSQDVQGSSRSAVSTRATISIVDDDLPDVVDAPGVVGGDTPGVSPVVIVDDGSIDAVHPKQTSLGGIEPRFRQRRIGVNRAQSRRRLWWLAVIGLAVVVIVGALAVLGSSLFAVDKVSITGNVYADPAALDAIVDDLTGTPVLLVDTSSIEQQVAAIPWVESARVATSFPSSVTIEIRERKPVAAMMGADGMVRVIDVDGRVLALVDGQPVALVWIAGPGTLDLAPGQFASTGYLSTASLVTKLTPEIRVRIDSVLVTSDGADLVMMLTSNDGLIEVRFGSVIGDNSQVEKLVRLQRTLNDVGDDAVTVIDVATAEVTVR